MKLLLVLVAVAQATFVYSKCPPPEVLVIKEVTICEREQSTLTCPFGSSIQIHEAFYGRQNNHICRHPSATDGSNINEICSSPNALEIVKNKCNGHRECNISSASNWLVDPCKNTYKYLEVSYSCSEPQYNLGN
ncbi:unnamed protein product [Nezara viridula]|uniref:SUEL-type lectin domain-containing protein n=1 Tax=Nezara viridula TaxID=85310 RepID=A0A9P0E5X3_NEZVI|nr:unnamed protein product [Nezara viridula]